MQQALRYAQQLDVPLAYATNGRETIEHNLRLGTERRVQAFAPPATAWSEYQAMHGLDDDGEHLRRLHLHGPYDPEFDQWRWVDDRHLLVLHTDEDGEVGLRLLRLVEPDA